MATWVVQRALDAGRAVHSVCYGRDGALVCGLADGLLGVSPSDGGGALALQRAAGSLEGPVLQLCYLARSAGLLAASDAAGTVTLLQPCPDDDFLEVAQFTAAAAPSALAVLVDGTDDYSILAANHTGELLSYAPFSTRFRLRLQDLEPLLAPASCLAILPVAVPLDGAGAVEEERFWLLCCSDGKASPSLPWLMAAPHRRRNQRAE
eukprot:EG_transcript_30491